MSEEAPLYEEELVPAFKALADQKRRRILDLLHAAPRTTGGLCEAFPELSRFAVMKHLRVLESARLVVVRRAGRARWNHLNAVPLQQVYERWLRPFEARWAARLVELKDWVERDDWIEAGEGGQAMPLSEGLTLGSMQIEQQVRIRATPARVFGALTADVGAWWGRPYVHDDEARALVLEARLGGRFYEDSGDGQGALYGTVTTLRPPRELVLAGPFGMSGLCHNVVTFALAPDGARATRLHLTHLGAGQITAERRAAYQAGWEDLLGRRLVALLERGERMGLGHEPPARRGA